MFTSEQLDALQAAAKAAVELADGAEWFLEEDLHLTADFEDADVAFIAAANPAVVLELVAAHRDVLEQGDELRKMLDSYTREYPQECNKRVAAEAVRDAALARIAQAEALHQSIDGECHTCSDENGPKLWPCPTVRALTEGEPSE